MTALAVLAVAAAVAYVTAAVHLCLRGDFWPATRVFAFCGGAVSVAAAALAPLPGGAFTVHMGQHVLLGMVAPLLFVLGRPVTLAFRALRPGSPRRLLLRLVHSRPAGWLVFPPVAALLDVGGLWVLYRTPLFAATHEHPWLHALVHFHVLVAGILFTASVLQLDPLRRRYGLVLRGVTLVAASAAHGVLAKTLYLSAPPHVSFADVPRGAELMYYGGDVVEIALAVVLALGWYAEAGRRYRAAGSQPAAAGSVTAGRR
ncbi:putative membrane protein [Amycolatopsis bartoniae]|uniref:Membrane protein n=1 Tax=Amycolatopsis bartoniae TaxID=941986 RepID=A0A8H9IXG9_9PSEU|nr:cytochrome c oxidase assembly protein [Amycolatopsis bartoniae]MBB2939011.1 putative membrane protein [Amycolatopsis bartoniae]GHF65606.1 membrane protein [Amycolatopsis bartoniae]